MLGTFGGKAIIDVIVVIAIIEIVIIEVAINI
jgi:hypothetical protein